MKDLKEIYNFTAGSLKFRPILEEDLEWARQLHNDPEVISVLTDPHEVSSEEQQMWYKKLKDSKSSLRIVIEKEEKIGLIRMDEIDNHNFSLLIGMDIVKEYRGKGLSKLIYEIMFKKIFCDQNMHRCGLMVAEFNERAYKLYQKLGFTEEGKLKDRLYKNGKFYDYIVMRMLKSEWERLYDTN